MRTLMRTLAVWALLTTMLVTYWPSIGSAEQGFTYDSSTYNIGKLSDELVAAGVPLLGITGSGNPVTHIVVRVADGYPQSSVDAVVAAHDASAMVPGEHLCVRRNAANDGYEIGKMGGTWSPLVIDGVSTSRTVGTTAPLSGGGDLSADRTLTLNDNGVTFAKMQDIGSARVMGRVTGGAGDPEPLTGTQVTTLLDAFTSTLKGLAPPSGGGTTNFLRADGTWVAPPSGGADGLGTDGDKGDVTVGGTGTTLSIDNDAVTLAKMQDIGQNRVLGRVTSGSGDPEPLTGTQVTTLLDTFTSGLKGVAPASGGGTTNFLRADGSWAAPPGGGSDPWTTVVLASPFSTTLTTNTNVTGLAFTPLSNKRYLVQVRLLLRTALATVGPRPGFAWPSGVTDCGGYLQVPNSATAYAYRGWGAASTQNAASTGIPDTTGSWLALGEAYFLVGAASGTFQITLASETAGTSVTVRAGSFLMYREIQ